MEVNPCPWCLVPLRLVLLRLRLLCLLLRLLLCLLLRLLLRLLRLLPIPRRGLRRRCLWRPQRRWQRRRGARKAEMHDVARQLCMDHMEEERDHFSQDVTQGLGAYLRRKRRGAAAAAARGPSSFGAGAPEPLPS